MVSERRSYRKQSFTQLMVVIIVLLLVNVAGQEYYNRLDLTTEKRFTLSEPTKGLLRNLDDAVFVRVYLDGEFPAGFKRLQTATREMLDEFDALSNKSIEYVFFDPSSISDMEQKSQFYNELKEKGIFPTNLKVAGNSGASQKIIFPALSIYYRGKELPVQLLENQIGFGPDEVLNNSIELLEYKLANALKKITQRVNPRVAFTDGNGELSDYELSDIYQSLAKLQYDVQRVNISTIVDISPQLDLLVVAKPTRPFDEKTKFKIDQYLMNGGSILWMIDNMNASMDSFGTESVFTSTQLDLNLDDQLFKYGVRINPDLVQDLHCNPIPLVVGMNGDQPQTDLFPWFYYPRVVSTNSHAIVNNLDAVAFKFASTIDTVGKPGLNKKTILLHTSEYSKAIMTPVRVHFSMVKEKPNPSTFQMPFLPLAVLVEGKFESVFKNRVAPDFQNALDSLKISFKEQADLAKMIVVADGDVIRNEVDRNGPLPLGYYPFTKQTFANKGFVLNCIEYLAEDVQLMATRNREVKIRLLDKTRVSKSKLNWQLLNILVPILLVLIFGLIYNFIRRRRFAN